MHPVLGLFEGDVDRTLEDIVGDLDAVTEVRILCSDLCAERGVTVVEGGKAVHEFGPWIARRGKKFRVDR